MQFFSEDPSWVKLAALYITQVRPPPPGTIVLKVGFSAVGLATLSKLLGWW